MGPPPDDDAPLREVPPAPGGPPVKFSTISRVTHQRKESPRRHYDASADHYAAKLLASLPPPFATKGSRRSSTRMTCTADHSPWPRAVGMLRAFRPAAIAYRLVAPAACSFAMIGATSAARCAARSWRTRMPAARAFADPLATSP